MTLRAMVLHGKVDGPCVWLSAAIHGDELNGVEVIRRVLNRIEPKELSGTIIAVPFVNMFGAISESRYLPDRRDLNRSFPGSPKGSLASRLAHIFMTEVVSRCEFGIDLHTGSDNRTNLPQIRADLDDAETRRYAEAFAAPVMVHARTVDGSLRGVASRRGIRTLLFEGGEAQRFDADVIATAVAGVRRVLATLGMIEGPTEHEVRSVESRRTSWVRARRSGIFRRSAELGEETTRGATLGYISDAFGKTSLPVRARTDGIIIGLSLNPIVRPGDALAHVAEVD